MRMKSGLLKLVEGSSMPDVEGLPVGALVIDAFLAPMIVILHSWGLSEGDGSNFRFMIFMVDENGSIRILSSWFFGRRNLEIARVEGRIVEPNGEG
jgi:hypothetical protein